MDGGLIQNGLMQTFIHPAVSRNFFPRVVQLSKNGALHVASD